MSAYGTIDAARAGMIYGIVDDIETLIVSSGAEFEYGDPVFVKQGEEEVAYEGNSGDATLVFAGVAVVSQKSSLTAAGKYEAYDEMNVLREGKVWVTVASGQTGVANKAAYVIHATGDSNYEKFTGSSSSTYDCGGYFRSNPTSDWLAVLEVRGLK